jgi:hypothetical protein
MNDKSKNYAKIAYIVLGGILLVLVLGYMAETAGVLYKDLFLSK